MLHCIDGDGDDSCIIVCLFVWKSVYACDTCVCESHKCINY